MKVRPLGSKVLVRRDDAPETTEGGIIIPDTANEKPLEGEVVAVGEGAILPNGKKVAMTVKKGDIVFFVVTLKTKVIILLKGSRCKVIG